MQDSAAENVVVSLVRSRRGSAATQTNSAARETSRRHGRRGATGQPPPPPAPFNGQPLLTARIGPLSTAIYSSDQFRTIYS